MAAGYKYALTVNGGEVNFKRLSARCSAPPIDASSRLNRDGSVNAGFSSKEKDLSTMRFELSQLVPDTSPASSPLTLAVGVNDVSWILAYNDVTLYSGESLYLEEYQQDGSVPGEGTSGMTFYSNEDFT